jgi:hypothetical protein
LYVDGGNSRQWRRYITAGGSDLGQAGLGLAAAKCRVWLAGGTEIAVSVLLVVGIFRPYRWAHCGGVCHPAGARSSLPGRRPWKVDCAVGSPLSGVAVVVAPLSGCVDGEEQSTGDLVLTVLRQWQLLDHVLEAGFGSGRLTVVRRCGAGVISGERLVLRHKLR